MIRDILNKNFIGIVLIVVAIAVSSYITGKVAEVRKFLFPDEVIAQHKYTIVTGTQELGRLVTTQYDVAKTGIKVEIHRGLLNAGYYSANHDVIGVIEAGIDFDEINENSVRFENDAYTVTLPTPIVTSCRIEYIDQKEGSLQLFAKDWDMVRQIAQAEALDQFAQEMIEAGVLEKAAENAAFRIGEFVKNLTGLPANVEFRDDSSPPKLPESCLPNGPSGWVKENGTWRPE